MKKEGCIAKNAGNHFFMWTAYIYLLKTYFKIMPLPSEHSCRIKEPSLFKKDSFRRIHLAKGLDAIIGKLIGKTTTTTQSLRYKKDVWSAERARKNCNAKGGKFEIAAKNLNRALSADHLVLHHLWKKLEKSDKEKLYGWTKEKIVKEHARITDILRNEGKKMFKKTKLDEMSWEIEKTQKMLTPSDIPNLLKPNRKLKKPKKSVKLSDTEKMQSLSFTELYNAHKEIHKKGVDEETSKIHSLIKNEYDRRGLIHPYWSELDKIN